MAIKHSSVPTKFASPGMLRIRAILMICLLIAQFVVGMTLDLFTKLPDSHPGTHGSYLSSTAHGYEWAITNGGDIALTTHTIIATLLVLGSIATLGFSIAARNKTWIIASSFGLAGVWLAFLNGVAFINTNLDKHSFAMAMTFMIALVSYGSGLYLSRQK